MKPHEITLNGERVACRIAGKGPALLLVHGMAGSSETWRHVMPPLAERYTVLAPDLLGQGESDKPRGDYSLGAHANTLRDLLDALVHKRATIVGQSLGGGVGHYPHCEAPERFVAVLFAFRGSTKPARLASAAGPATRRARKNSSLQ